MTLEAVIPILLKTLAYNGAYFPLKSQRIMSSEHETSQAVRRAKGNAVLQSVIRSQKEEAARAEAARVKNVIPPSKPRPLIRKKSASPIDPNDLRMSLAQAQHRLQHAEHLLAVLGYIWVSADGDLRPEPTSIDEACERLEHAGQFLQRLGFVSTGDGNFAMPSEQTTTSPGTDVEMAELYRLHQVEKLILEAGYVPNGDGTFSLPTNTTSRPGGSA